MAVVVARCRPSFECALVRLLADEVGWVRGKESVVVAVVVVGDVVVVVVVDTKKMTDAC